MPLIVIALFCVFSLVACVTQPATTAPANATTPTTVPASTDSLRVMTFNLRYDTMHDGINAWLFRRQAVADCILQFNPDLLGCQEALASQVYFFHEKLIGYTPLGVGRDDGQGQGEYALLLYKTEHFQKLDDGHFWLSPTPEKPGLAWDAGSIRIATWAKLKDLRTGQTFFFLTTHWDNAGEIARRESAKLIRAWLDQHAGDTPVIVAGDFNADEDDASLPEILTNKSKHPLFDAYRQLHPTRQTDEASFNDFKNITQGSRIDYILHTADFSPVEITIDRQLRPGTHLNLSDHYPITAILKIKQ